MAELKTQSGTDGINFEIKFNWHTFFSTVLWCALFSAFQASKPRMNMKNPFLDQEVSIWLVGQSWMLSDHSKYQLFWLNPGNQSKLQASGDSAAFSPVQIASGPGQHSKFNPWLCPPALLQVSSSSSTQIPLHRAGPADPGLPFEVVSRCEPQRHIIKKSYHELPPISQCNDTYGEKSSKYVIHPKEP